MITLFVYVRADLVSVSNFTKQIRRCYFTDACVVKERLKGITACSQM